MHDPFRRVQRIGLARVAQVLRVELRRDGSGFMPSQRPTASEALVGRRPRVMRRRRG